MNHTPTESAKQWSETIIIMLTMASDKIVIMLNYAMNIGRYDNKMIKRCSFLGFWYPA